MTTGFMNRLEKTYQLFHIYENIPEKDRQSAIKVGDRPAVSIRQLLEDYFSHLVLHENQVIRIMEINRA